MWRGWTLQFRKELQVLNQMNPLYIICDHSTIIWCHMNRLKKVQQKGCCRFYERQASHSVQPSYMSLCGYMQGVPNGQKVQARFPWALKNQLNPYTTNEVIKERNFLASYILSLIDQGNHFRKKKLEIEDCLGLNESRAQYHIVCCHRRS